MSGQIVAAIAILIGLVFVLLERSALFGAFLVGLGFGRLFYGR